LNYVTKLVDIRRPNHNNNTGGISRPFVALKKQRIYMEACKLRRKTTKGNMGNLVAVPVGPASEPVVVWQCLDRPLGSYSNILHQSKVV